MGIRVILCTILMFCVCLTATVTAADWPHWRGPDYNGISTESGWDADGAKVLWHFALGSGYSSVSISEGKAYSTGNIDDTDIVYCIDIASGKEVWRHSYPEPLAPKYYKGGTSATPTITGGKVFTISKSGKVFCLDAKTGKVVWKKALAVELPGWGFAGSAVVIDDMVILNAGAKGMALSIKDGSTIWDNGNGKAGYASAVPYVANGQKAIALFIAEHVVGLVAATGKELWSFPWKTKYGVNAADPVISGDLVFVASGYNYGCALLKISGGNVEKMWKNKNMRSHMSGPVLLDGFLYGINQNQLTCLDLKTGLVKWSDKSIGNGSLMAADGKLIVLSEKGELITAIASPEAFKPITTTKILSNTSWTPPVLANGKIFARDHTGDMVCVELNTKAKSSSDSSEWPQWHGAGRDNISKETDLLKKWPDGGPKMLWSYDQLSDGYSTVAIASGKIYTTGAHDKTEYLTCLDMDGNFKWKKPYGRMWEKSYQAARTTPTVDDGLVYVISGMLDVACFDAETGQEKWSVDTTEKFGANHGYFGGAESALIVDDKMICTPSGDKTAMVALNKKTGEVVWTAKTLGQRTEYCSPICIERGGKKIIITILKELIIGVNAANGEILWQYATKDYQQEGKRALNVSTPTYHNGAVYFTSGYNKGDGKFDISPDGMSITKVWNNSSLDNHHGGVVLVDGYLYGSNWITNAKGNWLCVDWNTGKMMYDTKWFTKGAISYADGMLYCWDEDDGNFALVKADPAAFEVVSSFKVTMGEGKYWAHPVINDGRLYIRHGSVLMVYDIKA